MTTTALWLIAGAVFIGVEMFGIPGIGFLFAGIAALIVGSAVEFGVIGAENTLQQIVLFLLLSCATAALLWKRLKRQKTTYHNMIGTEATVAAGGLRGSIEGQVKWSGTLMRARLAHNTDVDLLAEGTYVIIKAVEGNLLLVTPKA